jgi:hypothetical protein
MLAIASKDCNDSILVIAVCIGQREPQEVEYPRLARTIWSLSCRGTARNMTVGNHESTGLWSHTRIVDLKVCGSNGGSSRVESSRVAVPM